MRAPATLIAWVLALAVLAVGSSPARADLFGPIELASTSAPAGGLHEQADEARFPVLSADGRYVAFAGSFGGEPGIWRRDLATGAMAMVAAGDATLPSISASGRYVSFTTGERLVPEDTNNSPDVYVRDMEPAAGEPEYTLVSAVSGTDEGAKYTYTGGLHIYSPEQEETEFGSIASARSAISADGRYVAFVTTAQSNLLGGAEPTPALEVLVRDLATKETRLVSAEYSPGSGWGADRPVQPQTAEGGQFGAVFPGGSNMPPFHIAFAPNSQPAANEAKWVGASISADGSTVAWMGQDLGEQAQLLPHEQTNEAPVIAEPLWRRIDEAGAPIRRISGGSDPENPGCAASGEQELPHTPSLSDPCAGPFEQYREGTTPEGLFGTKNGADFVPQLSADGNTVAIVTGARELAGGEFQFPNAESHDDLFVVNMASGLSRVQALRRLSAIGGGGATQEVLEKSSAILDYSVSPDGSQVAFTTQRTAFPLGSPAFVSAPAVVPGMQELFDVDLANDTLTRVTHGYENEDQRSEELPAKEIPGVDPYAHLEGAYSPSFDEDGNTLSFASTANNLVYGDGNNRPDAFVVHRVLPAVGVVPQYVSSAPGGPLLTAPWRIGVRAASLANGSVRLYVEIPGPGSLAAGASSSVVVHIAAAKARRSAHGSRRRTLTTVANRAVASAKTSVKAVGEGITTMTLNLTRAYRSLASARGGLSATLKVTFTAHGHAALHVSLPVAFVRTLRTPKAKASKRRAAARGGRGRSR